MAAMMTVSMGVCHVQGDRAFTQVKPGLPMPDSLLVTLRKAKDLQHPGV